MLVTTEERLASEGGARLVGSLGKALATVFAGVRPHVPASVVQAAVRQARSEDIDAVVSFGGGSCADAAKAVCFFMEQQAGTPGASFMDRPLVAHVAVPTTYSGAEATAVFAMTDPSTRRKSAAGGPTSAPVVVAYDPVLTLGLPPRASAETGMSALAHGVEAAWSPTRTPEAEAVALACIARVGAALPEVVERPESLEGRREMLIGAALGGRCRQNATGGAHQGLTQLLGGRTGMAHGLAAALLLEPVVAFTAEAVPDEAGRIGAALGDRQDPAGACGRLRGRLGLPASLSECGVSEDDVDAVVRLSEANPSVAANSRPVGEHEARAILEAAW